MLVFRVLVLLFSFCLYFGYLCDILLLNITKIVCMVKILSFLFVILKNMHIFVLLLNERCFTY